MRPLRQRAAKEASFRHRILVSLLSPNKLIPFTDNLTAQAHHYHPSLNQPTATAPASNAPSPSRTVSTWCVLEWTRTTNTCANTATARARRITPTSH